MKTQYHMIYILLAALLFSCSDKDYVSNDPSAMPNAPQCYDVNDLYQDYSIFFKPSHGWVGDPMPYYEDGKFHVFYLQDARDGKPTFHPWYKATTTDFLSYVDNGEMIPCGTEKEQDGALGTGSVFKHDGVYYGFYTGHNGKLEVREKILLATSTDLEVWNKVEGFELVASDGYDRNEFRDPIIFKDEASNTFKMLISTRADYKGSWRAVLAQYSSTDLKNWTLEEPFYDDESTFMVECPDVFIEGDYQYLIYSDIADNDRMVHYKYRKVGTSTWITPASSNLDGRFYYAAKTASNGNERYLFGWCPTRNGYDDYSEVSWAGSLVVHQLIQDEDGTLRVVIPQSVNNKANTSKELKTSSNHSVQRSGATYTLDATSEKAFNVFEREKGITKIAGSIEPNTSTRFGIEFGACGNRKEVFQLTFDLEKNKLNLEKVVAGEENSIITSVDLAVSKKDKLDIVLVMENAISTIYVNNEIALTSRIYKMNQNPWGIFAENGKVTFSNLQVMK